VSQFSKRARSDEGAREFHACMKPSRRVDEGFGCSSADVASERVSCRDDSDGLRCRLESCVVVVMGGTFDVRRSWAGQCHGSDN
jgi:hypothetical protein